MASLQQVSREAAELRAENERLLWALAVLRESTEVLLRIALPVADEEES